MCLILFTNTITKPCREIEFTTTRIKGDLAAGKTRYQGHLQHNAAASGSYRGRVYADATSRPNRLSRCFQIR